MASFFVSYFPLLLLVIVEVGGGRYDRSGIKTVQGWEGDKDGVKDKSLKVDVFCKLVSSKER